MNVQDLTNVLLELMEKHGRDVEIRVGDQIELGPYSHDKVGGVWTSLPNNAGDVRYVILCAEDTDWQDEFEGDITREDTLPLVWTPPAPIERAPAAIALGDSDE